MNRILRRALLSVSDKTGIVELARSLHEFGIDIVSTGGTAAALKAAGLPVIEVSALTGFPELLEGRVKTLHPRIHGALLAKRDRKSHVDDMQTHGITPIDLVVVNLYPFERRVASGAGFEECLDQIDVGGPAMIRAAAKNHGDVAVLVDPEDYQSFVDEVRAHSGEVTVATRKALAAKAFARTAHYDAEISNWLRTFAGTSVAKYFTLAGTLASPLRYGENPHQSASLYATGFDAKGIAAAPKLQGKELSYNNIVDAESACRCLQDLDPYGTACVIVKHANPCGAACGSSIAAAYAQALACDPVSAFGGIVAVNGPLDEAAASEIVKIFTEVIIAPAASERALDIIATKRNLRLLLLDERSAELFGGEEVRSVSGGFLVQQPDDIVLTEGDFRCVTRRAPTPSEIADMKFAFAVAKHVKSNAIVFARSLATVGIGAGQASRLDAVRIAVHKAKESAPKGKLGNPLAGSVVASDAFFPFADGLEAAADAGATAIIQPGGSLNDPEVIAAADQRGLAMIFTGVRHFRH